MSEKLDWHKIPSKHFTVSGLPFYSGGPWQRFNQAQLDGLPEAVITQARYPAGVVIRFSSDTRNLKIKLSVHSQACGAGIDVMVDGVLWRSVLVNPDHDEVELFRNVPAELKQIELYLPGNQALSPAQLGVDVGCQLEAAQDRNDQLPITVYGSSIVQGAGSHLSCMNYPSILTRELGIDINNFGFYGAGRGEPEVLEKILALPAQAIIFDLGKSFGNQAADVYGAMLKQARQSHPDAKLICITPIYCLRERYDEKFRAFSDSIRQKFSQQANSIDGVQLIDGLTLLGPDDWRCFSEDGLHPNEWGYALIAQRLLERVVF
ncbi:hypothetical protein IB286_10690 [Spongiibacter sp. KMU-158]|uniref:SGNH hydrolase-type esterase domain-containing protein n=1 Tax=Spongiibacter pelagi TaxID=2760804 RepID=A0A927GW87_9GAMM|nr:SGNH/GDSL hydrolase family protein [Spongiibacter pelagi]MBD2859471.1 hypothetical protein [Spongiibacter pelagi]